jgi:hypothetical protein
MFIIYIPVSVVLMLKALDEVNDIVKFWRTDVRVEVVDIKEILDMDEGGDGEVSLQEYVLYMLRQTGAVDGGLLDGLEGQFKALDTSGDGTLGMDDFPVGMGLKKVHSTNCEWCPRSLTPAWTRARAAPPTTRAASSASSRRRHRSTCTTTNTSRARASPSTSQSR